jgi:predicted metal-dependent peptidase
MYSVLESTIIELIINYPYYANLISLMDKKLTTSVPIAAISITSRINLMINPNTFNTLPKEVRVGILLHECYHIIHNHIARSKTVSKSFNKALNIAADRAINEHLHYMTKNNKVVATVPDSLNVTIDGKKQQMKFVTKKNFKDTYPNKVIHDNESMEYYYKFLKDNAEKGDGPGDFGGDMETLDDHDGWGDSEVSAEQAEQITKNALNKAAQKTAAGQIPGDVQSAIDKLNNSVVPWRSVLQRFIAKCSDMSIDSSRKRRSRRFGLMSPGTIKEPILKLGVALDTSGSVHDKYLTQFFSELNKLHNMGYEIHVVQADMVVQSSELYNPKKPIQVKGRGGTAFQPAIDVLEKIECDALVYFTDGETGGETPKSKKPILWALCPSYSMPNGALEKNCIKITLPEEKNV